LRAYTGPSDPANRSSELEDAATSAWLSKAFFF
jgi:hypothetical protein